MTDNTSQKSTFRVADLAQNRPTDFALRPDQATLAHFAQQLGLSTLRKVFFKGDLFAVGDSDWQLSASLGATVIQPCVVTLEPVTTRIEIEVTRLYVAQMPELGGDDDEEIEMPDDENAEPLPAEIDISEVLFEMLALNLPQFPRSTGAQLSKAAFTEPGKKAMTDEDARPFAGLEALRNQLGTKDDE